MKRENVRTTVELQRSQHARLLKIASLRGLKGFSPVIQEAVEFYLEHHDEDQHAAVIKRALELEGCLGAEEAAALESTTKGLRSTWR